MAATGWFISESLSHSRVRSPLMEDMSEAARRDFVSMGTRRNGVATELLVRTTPTRVAAKTGVAA